MLLLLLIALARLDLPLGLAVMAQSVGVLWAGSCVLGKSTRPFQTFAEGLANNAAAIAALNDGAVFPAAVLLPFLVLIFVLVLGLGCPAALRPSARHGPAPGCECVYVCSWVGRGWGWGRDRGLAKEEPGSTLSPLDTQMREEPPL